MHKFEFINEKGNISGKVRNMLRAKAIKNALAKLDETAFVTNKGIVIQIGIDAITNQPIYFVLAPSVSLEAETPVKEKQAKEVEQIEVPDLF